MPGRIVGRHRRRRQRILTRPVPTLAAVALLAVAGGLLLFGGGRPARPSARTAGFHPAPTTTTVTGRAAPAAPTTATTAPATTTVAPTTVTTTTVTTTTVTTTTVTTTTVTTTTLAPGSQPQTDALPSATNRQFRRKMAALWRAVVTDRPAVARRAFFPEAAYQQVKTLPDDAADYRWRLLSDFDLDIGAAHALLGADPAGASLVAVDVPMSYAHWVPPGVCANRVGYFEVANSRVVYRQAGAVRSFGIASLISWRGVWYVVHLGAILRSADIGTVDDPASGPGVAAPSSTC